MSKAPTTAIGGVTYAITREIEDTIDDPLRFCAVAESSCDGPIWQSMTIDANCQTMMNRQQFFDTTVGADLSESTQFRLVGAVSQALGGVTGSFTVQIYMDYEVEVVGERQPDNSLKAVITPENSWTVSADGELVSSLPTSIANFVYFVNPALVECTASISNKPQPPIRCFYASTTAIYCHSTPGSAMSSPLTPNVHGDGTAIQVSCDVAYFEVTTSSNVGVQPALKKLTDENKTLRALVEPLVSDQAQIRKDIESLSDVGGVEGPYHSLSDRLTNSETIQDTLVAILAGLADITLGTSNTGVTKDMLKAAVSAALPSGPVSGQTREGFSLSDANFAWAKNVPAMLLDAKWRGLKG